MTKNWLDKNYETRIQSHSKDSDYVIFCIVIHWEKQNDVRTVSRSLYHHPIDS